MQNLKKIVLNAVTPTALLCFSSVEAEPRKGMEDLNARLESLEQKQTSYPSASPQPKKGIDLFVFGDFFGWQMNEEGIPIAIKTQNPFVFPDFLEVLQHGKVKNLKFERDFGSRLGLGYNWNRDKIDNRLTWLRFFTSQNRVLHAGSGQLQPVQLQPNDIVSPLPGAIPSPGAGFAKVHGHGYLHLNQIDLDLGRAFYVGKWVSLRPQFGIRTTWLQQHISVNYTDNQGLSAVQVPRLLPGNSYSVKKKSRWWGIGPEAGMEMRLALGKGFELLGNLAGAIEYGFHTLKEKDKNTTVEDAGLDSSLVSVRDNFRMSHPIFDLLVGVGWDYMFEGDRCHLRLEAGWEQHIYYSQKQFLNFVDNVAIGNFVTELGDKTFQGWNVAFRLDF